MNTQIKEFIVPKIKQKQFGSITDETNLLNFNAQGLSLSEMTFYRSDFIAKFIKINKMTFHTLSLQKLHFEENIMDLAKFLGKEMTKIKSLTLNDCDIGDTSLKKML